MKTIFLAMRPPFLLLTPVCVFLGTSTVMAAGMDVEPQLFALILLGALFAHASVNMLNEYFDFRSGLDLATERTPFSGGSGALPRNPEMAGAVLASGILAALLTVAVGLLFAHRYGPGIIPIGVAGVIIIVTYTQWINRNPYLCLIAPGTGFGLLMVVGTQYLLGGGHSALAWLAALVPFFLVNNLLLLNQYPDIAADAAVGRHHMPIAHGVPVSNGVYALFAALTAVLIVGCVISGWFPVIALIAVVPLLLSTFALAGALKHGDRIGQHPQHLAANVAASLLTPLALGITLAIS